MLWLTSLNIENWIKNVLIHFGHTHEAGYNNYKSLIITIIKQEVQWNDDQSYGSQEFKDKNIDRSALEEL